MTSWRCKMSVFSQTLWICCWVVMFLLSTSNATTAILSTPSASLANSTVNIASPKSLIPNSSLGKSGLSSDSSTPVLQISPSSSFQALASPNSTAVPGGYSNLSSLLSDSLASPARTIESTLQLVNSTRNSHSSALPTSVNMATKTFVSSSVTPSVSSNYTATPRVASATYSRSVNGSLDNPTLSMAQAKQTSISKQQSSPEVSLTSSVAHLKSSNTSALIVTSSMPRNITSGVDLTAVGSSAVVMEISHNASVSLAPTVSNTVPLVTTSLSAHFTSGNDFTAVGSSAVAMETSLTVDVPVVPTVPNTSAPFAASSVLSGNFTGKLGMTTIPSSIVAIAMSPTANMSGLHEPTASAAYFKSQVVNSTSDVVHSTVDASNSTARLGITVSHDSTTVPVLTNQTLNKWATGRSTLVPALLPSINHTHKLVSMDYTATPMLSSSVKAFLEFINQTSKLTLTKQTLLPTLLSSVKPSEVDLVNQSSKLVTGEHTVLLTMSSNVNQTSKLVSSGQSATLALPSNISQTRKLASAGVTPQPVPSSSKNSTRVVSTLQLVQPTATHVTPSLVARKSFTSTFVLSKMLASSIPAVHISSKSAHIVPTDVTVHATPNTTHVGQKPIYSTSRRETLSMSNSSTIGIGTLPSSSVTKNGTKDYMAMTSSEPILQSHSITPSSLPDSYSKSDDFVLISYATPCYIYYVITKTVTMATANQTLGLDPVTPTLTLDKLNMSTATADIPTVTIKPTVTMATEMSSAARVRVDMSSSGGSVSNTIVSGVHVSLPSASAVKSTELVASTSNPAATASSQIVLPTASLSRKANSATVDHATTTRVLNATLAVSGMKPKPTESLGPNISISTHSPIAISQSLYQTQSKGSPSQILHVPNTTHSPSSELQFVASSIIQSLTHSQAIPIPTATHSRMILVPNATHSQMMSVPNATHSQMISVPNATHSQMRLVPNATHSQMRLVPNATHSQMISVPNATHSQMISVPTATHSQLIPVPTTTHSQLIPNPNATNSQVRAIPSSTQSKAVAVPKVTLSQTLQGSIVAPTAVLLSQTVNESVTQQNTTAMHSRVIPQTSQSLMGGSVTVNSPPLAITDSLKAAQVMSSDSATMISLNIKVSSTKQILNISAANVPTMPRVSVATSVLPAYQEKSSVNGSTVIQKSLRVSSSATNVSGISPVIGVSTVGPQTVPPQTNMTASSLQATRSSNFAKSFTPNATIINSGNSTIDNVTTTPPPAVTLSTTTTPPLSVAYSQGIVSTSYSQIVGSASTFGSRSSAEQNDSLPLVSSANANETVKVPPGTQSVTPSSLAPRLSARLSRRRRALNDFKTTGNSSVVISINSTHTNAVTVTALLSRVMNTTVQALQTSSAISPNQIPKPASSNAVVSGGIGDNSSTVASKTANFIQPTTSQTDLPLSGSSLNRAASDVNSTTPTFVSLFPSVANQVSTQIRAESVSKSATAFLNVASPSDSSAVYETATNIVGAAVNSTISSSPSDFNFHATSNNVWARSGQTTSVQAKHTINSTVALSPSLNPQQTVSSPSRQVTRNVSTLVVSKTTGEQALQSTTAAVSPSPSVQQSSPDVTNGTKSSAFVVAWTTKQQALRGTTTIVSSVLSSQKSSSDTLSSNKSSTLVVTRSTKVQGTVAVSPSPSIQQSSRDVTNNTSALAGMTTVDRTVFPTPSTQQKSSLLLKATPEISTLVVGMTTTRRVAPNKTVNISAISVTSLIVEQSNHSSNIAVGPSVEMSSAIQGTSANQSSADAVNNSTSFPGFSSATASAVPRMSKSSSKLAVMATNTLTAKLKSTSVFDFASAVATVVPSTNMSISKYVVMPTETPSTLPSKKSSPSINATSVTHEMSVVVATRSPQSSKETQSTFIPVLQPVSSLTPVVVSLAPTVTFRTGGAPSSTQLQPQSSAASEATKNTTLSTSILSYSGVAKATISVSAESSLPSRVKKHPVITVSSLGMCYVVITTRIVQATVVPTPSTSLLLPVNATSVKLAPSNSTVGVKMTHTASSTVPHNATAISPNVTVISAAATSAVQVNATSAIQLNATIGVPSTSSVSTVLLQDLSSSYAFTQPLRSSPVQSIKPTQVTLQSSLVQSTTTSTSSTPMTSTVLPSATYSVVAATSSLTPTTQPTQPPPEIVALVMEVPEDVIVDQLSFKADMEAKLEQAYIVAKKNSARRRRATQGVDATITKMQREGFSKSVDVEFYITENNKTVSAVDTAKAFSSVSAKTLGDTLTYKVVQMPQVASPPIESRYIVSMVIEDFRNTDISIASNKVKLQDKLAAYYRARVSSQAAVATVISRTLHESSGKVYLEFYTTSNSLKILASEVVRAFEGATLVSLTTELEQIVLVAPYIADTLKATKFDYVSIRVGLNTSSQDLAGSAFRQELGDKLAIVYKEARDSRRLRRKKRAVGSITATIVNATRTSNPSRADVVFFIADAGEVLNATYVVLIMNQFTILRMTLTAKPYSVFVAPAAYYVAQPTDAPPVPITPEPVQYWIIGAVLGPVAFVVIILVLVLLYWRWKKGAPQTKVEPETMQMMKRDRAKMTTGHFDVARYAQGSEPSMKATALNRAYESEGDEKPVRRETSLRRKVQKQRAAPPPREGRKNRTYEESEEEDEEGVTDVTPTGSRHRLVQAQPGPGMLYKKAHQEPVRSADRPRPPVRAPPPHELEEDSETGESESESESVMTTRTDQTKYSAAQVPAVAVVGVASGPPRYAPVRFRSSVHPAPSLPPLDMKHTSLVGPREEDERDIRKNKLTKRELKQKADIERWRNKQRQRERKEGRHADGRDRPESKSERKAWARSQGQIDSVLEPGTGMEPIIRGRKRRPRKPKKREDSVPTEDQNVQLSGYRDLRSPRAEREGRGESSASPTESESEIDMEETRRRMHTLLEDAFTLFGPSLTGKRRKGDEATQQVPEPTQLLQQAHPLNGQPQTMPPGVLARPMVPPRYAGSQPALPEPPPAHGRASEPTPRQRRRLGATQPQAPRVPGFPVRAPVRPPLISKDPMVVWDPMDRQRYVNQRLGYPMYGRPPPGSFAYADPNGQGAVYLTPVQQQPDGLGGSIWSPYAAEDAMAELYPDLAKANYPGALGTSPQKDSSYLSHPSIDSTRSHDTALDMNDGYSRQRPPAFGQSPQPLIRSIKEELLRLGQGVQKKTPITEL